MDPRLAEIYGTNEDIGDVEKTAAAELAEKLAEENGMDIDDMTEEDIEALAAEVLSDESADESDDSDESGEKLAEADYIGRVMAHAYVQELREIEKTAGERMDKFKAKVKSMYEGAKGGVGRAYGATKEHVMKHPKKYIAGGVGAAGLGGYAAYRKMRKGGKSKRSSATPAFDALAQARAEEILAESGAGQADQWDVLSSAVDERAMEMLAEAGYDFE